MRKFGWLEILACTFFMTFGIAIVGYLLAFIEQLFNRRDKP